MGRGSRNRRIQSAKFGSNGTKIPMHVLPSAKETFGPTPGRVRNHRSQALLCRLHNSRLLETMRILHDCEEAANPKVGSKPSTPFGVRPRFGVPPRITRQCDTELHPMFRTIHRCTATTQPPCMQWLPQRVTRKPLGSHHDENASLLQKDPLDLSRVYSEGLHRKGWQSI